MAQVSISFELDESIKSQMEKACDFLEISMAEAFTMFAKKVGGERRIPFEEAIDPFYSERNMAAIDEAYERIKQGRVVVKTMEELEAMEVG